MAPARNRGFFLALAGIAILLATTHIAYRPATPLGREAPQQVFSADRTKALLKELVGSGTPHPIGSSDGTRIRDSIVRRLAALGYSTELQTDLVCNDQGVCGTPVNVIATLPRSSSIVGASADAVLLTAHYDSVPAGPGASDNGAGVATVLEIARILAAMPAPRHPVVLLLNEGEEAGLLGALLFVREHPLAKQVKAAVNLEARGTSGPSLMFETGSANAWAMRLYDSAIRRPQTNSLYYFGYQILPNDTDFTVFKAAGYQGFNFAFLGDVGRYHTALDTWANADPRSIQEQGDHALAAVLALADADTLRPPSGEAIFFDVFARAFITWPAVASVPAAIAALLLLLAEAAILLRKVLVTARQIIWGWVGMIGMLLFAVALTVAMLALLVAIGKVPPLDGPSWIPQPMPMNLAAAAVAFLSAGSAAVLFARHAGLWGFWVSGTLLIAVLSVVSAAFAPGTCFVFLAAAVAAGLTALPCISRVMNARVPSATAIDAAALVPALAIFATVLPLLPVGYAALGSLAWPFSTFLLGLGTAALLPLLAAADHQVRQSVIALAALTAAAGILLTAALPTYTAAWPERINFEYRLDADARQAHWLVRTDSGRLPPPIAAATRFDAVPRSGGEGGGSLRFSAPAPRFELAAPELTRVPLAAPGTTASPNAADEGGSPSHYELLLKSPRGAPVAAVVFPASAKISQVTVMTRAGASPARLRVLKSGATRLEAVGLSPAGLKFGIDLPVHAQISVQVFDRSYGLIAGQFLQRTRPLQATSSQDGDLTVVHRTVSLGPAAGR